jgi:hypothetical protein
MEIPGTSIDRFERTRRIIRGLCCALRVIDVNSPLQALERMSIGAEQVLEETDVIRGHHQRPLLIVGFLITRMLSQ